MSQITATLTKVLHAYGDLEIQETMRFANVESATRYALDMLHKRVNKPCCGTAYTVTAVEF